MLWYCNIWLYFIPTPVFHYNTETYDCIVVIWIKAQDFFYFFILPDGAPNRVSTNHSHAYQHMSYVYADEWLPLEKMYYKLRCKLLHNTADESYWFCVLCMYGAAAQRVRFLTGSSVSGLNGASGALVFAAALGWFYVACLSLSSFPLVSTAKS